MNRIDIVNEVALRAGYGQSFVANTAAPTNHEEEQMVLYVDRAYQEIQDLHWNWMFLWDEFSASTVASTATITKPATLKQVDKNDFSIFLTSAGSDTKQRLRYRDWGAFRWAHRIDTAEGYPNEVTIRPDGDLQFHPIPDGVYTVEFGGWTLADTMTADADVPLIPADYQQIIVEKALTLYAADDEAGAVYQSAMTAYVKLLAELEAAELPKLTAHHRAFA